MPRQSKLRKKDGHWFSQAGNRQGAYFGRIDQVSYTEAKRNFSKYLATLSHQTRQSRLPTLSVAEVCDVHLAFIERNRSAALYRQRKSLLNQLCNHCVGDWNQQRLPGKGELVGKLRGTVLARGHVDQYLDHRRSMPSRQTGKPLGDKARRAVVIAIKACWNWAANTADDGGGGLLPEDHRPLAKLPRGYIQPKDLSEADLPTDEEIEIIHRWSAVDLSKVREASGRWRVRTPDEYYANPEWRVFADLMQVYDATGARTGELCAVLVRDVMVRTRQLCLGRHKRSQTLSNPTVRNIQLDTEIIKILTRNAHGKQTDDPLFTRLDGRAWTQEDVNRRLRVVKAAAAEHNQVVRDRITPYSFRDLYISELLMIGTPPFQVAKMAGTSLREIERTYGHFFNRDLAAAQEKLARTRKQHRHRGQCSKLPRELPTASF